MRAIVNTTAAWILMQRAADRRREEEVTTMEVRARSVPTNGKIVTLLIPRYLLAQEDAGITILGGDELNWGVNVEKV
jgi:hypothetical protein